MTPPKLLRLLDANANRALEGLRVAEEVARLLFEEPRTFRRLRALRHAVASAVRSLPVGSQALLAARRSGRDIGRQAPGGRLASIEHLVVVNFQRAKESLRVLEECARLLAPRHAMVFQRLRFRTYETERDLLLHVAAVRHPRPGRARTARRA